MSDTDEHIDDDMPVVFSAEQVLVAGLKSERKTTRKLATRIEADLDRLRERVDSEQRIADLQRQLSAERAKLTGRKPEEAADGDSV